MKNLQNMNIFGAHYCPRAARAQGSMARAWRALPVIIFFGNGQGGHWILPGRAGKTGTGMPIKHHYNWYYESQFELVIEKRGQVVYNHMYEHFWT